MGDDGAQRLLVLGPVIENGAPVEEHHIGQGAGLRQLFALSKAHALEQAEQIEFALGLHFAQHIVFREILDPEDDIAGKSVKSRWQPRMRLGGQCVKFLERRRFERA